MPARITGNTFPVKEQLRALGGRWNGALRCWEVPDENADRAWELVGGKPAPAPAGAPAKTPESVAGAWCGKGRAVPVGTLRGMPLFAKYLGGGVFAVDANLQVRSIRERDGRWLLTDPRSYREDPLTEEEVAGFRDAARAAIVATKAEYDAAQAPKRNYLGVWRGRPVYGGGQSLTWQGEESDRIYSAGTRRGLDPEAPITRGGEVVTDPDVEELRPMFRALAEKVRAAEAAKEKSLREWREGLVEGYRSQDRWPISEGEGYGGRPFIEGETFAARPGQVAEGWPEYLTVVESSREYCREDGMSLGVGADRGYIYSCVCRAATGAEARAVRERAEARERAAAAASALNSVKQRFRAEGERPEGRHDADADGERVNLGDGQTPYGGGEWFVVGTEWVWYVRNNGHDGDDWSYNNVCTGGAGAIGWRVRSTPELVEQIRSLSATAHAKD